MSEDHTPVLCPITPELVKLLKQPGGLTTQYPVRCWLDDDNVLQMQILYPEPEA